MADGSIITSAGLDTVQPEAPRKQRKITIELMRRVAAERGGECLSTEYKNPYTRLKWRCSRGHVWHSRPVNVLHAGSWCKECGNKRRADAAKHTIEDMRALARERGGVCLSEVYETALTPLRWECECGYRWSAKPNRILNGHWCAQCAGVAKLRLGDLKALAADRGGQCVSDSYRDNKAPLEWRCAAGHVWLARAADIKNGGWCPECAGVGTSVGERLCRAVLEQMFGCDFPKARPDWLVGRHGRRLELDGLAEGLNAAFEYQGPHHYGAFGWYPEEVVVAQQARDALKAQMCCERGIRLIVVPAFKPWLRLPGCIDQIEHAVLWVGLRIPKRWRRPTGWTDVRGWLEHCNAGAAS